jgi:hypothetical protein
MSRGFKITLALIGAVVLAAIVVQPIFHRKDGPGFAAARTHAELRAIANASRAYFEEYGTWPTSFGDLTINPKKIIFVESAPFSVVDGWNRPVVYQPYDAKLGYGSVLSLGKDGKPGRQGLRRRYGSPLRPDQRRHFGRHRTPLIVRGVRFEAQGGCSPAMRRE